MGTEEKIFKFDPVIIPIGDGLTYKLAEDFLFKYKTEIIIAPKGFESDWASVPRFFWRIIPPHQYPHASLGHDFLYAVKYFSRQKCDLFFYDALRERGASWLRRYAMYRAVRDWGWLVWNNHSLVKVNALRKHAGLSELATL